MPTIAKIASEAGHWYTKSGELVDGATLRDARKMNLAPSVTKIIDSWRNYGLEKWLTEQAIYSALTLPRLDGESDKDFARRIMSDSRQEGRDAADRGTQIHAAIERHFAGDYCPPEFAKHCESVERALWECGFVGEISTEKTFAHRWGFGGKVDLHGTDWVADIKTTEKDLSTIKPYKKHIWQLAAYRTGLGMSGARCANVFVHVDGGARLIEHSEDDLRGATKFFFHILKAWQEDNNYKPRW